MREIRDHIVNPANDQIKIVANDAPGLGDVHHRYELTGFDTNTNPSKTNPEGYAHAFSRLVLLFQNGAINEAGVNGVTQEALMAVVADRLRSFQAGPYACRENALALTKIEEAMHWLQQRTLRRMREGVEGTMKL